MLNIWFDCDVKHSLGRPGGFREVEATTFPANRQMKVVRLSALPTGRLPPPPPQGHSGAGSIRSPSERNPQPSDL